MLIEIHSERVFVLGGARVLKGCVNSCVVLIRHYGMLMACVIGCIVTTSSLACQMILKMKKYEQFCHN